MLSDQQ